MSPESDFEAGLRNARASLPEPEAAATARASALAIAAIKRRRRRLRSTLLIGASLVLALGIGIGVGTLATPSGTAAQGPVGLGFLPERGWNVVQSGTRATLEQPAYAVAANVPIDSQDVTGGAPDPSGLPYETLLRLAPQGIVMVATFTRVDDHAYLASDFPETKLPLRLADATPFIEYGTQIRPEEPLGEYQLRSFVNGYHVDLSIYFGTSTPPPAMLAAAQQQLDKLVVRSATTQDRTTAASGRTAVYSAPPVVDQTRVCATSLTGGLRKVEVRGHAGIREDSSSWKQVAFAVFSTGSVGARLTALDNSLAWITAGAPSGTTTMDIGFNQSWPHTTGTVALNRKLCRASKATVPLTPARLQGGPVGPFGDAFDCAAPRRVLVRLRVVFRAASGLHEDGLFLRTNTPIREARLAMRSVSGKPLAYADVLESGKARLFTAPSCRPS